MNSTLLTWIHAWCWFDFSTPIAYNYHCIAFPWSLPLPCIHWGQEGQSHDTAQELNKSDCEDDQWGIFNDAEGGDEDVMDCDLMADDANAARDFLIDLWPYARPARFLSSKVDWFFVSIFTRVSDFGLSIKNPLVFCHVVIPSITVWKKFHSQASTRAFWRMWCRLQASNSWWFSAHLVIPLLWSLAGKFRQNLGVNWATF